MDEQIIGGWDAPEVAQAQLDLVLSELSNLDACGPYNAFRWAMDTIGLKRGTLLDAGCGVGHYGVLCERFYPDIDYTGTDASQAMIERARELVPLGHFKVSDFMLNGFGYFDIVLLSQAVEMLDDPPAALDYVLCTARGHIILNRIRLTTGASHRITEHTYCGNMGQNWLWNRSDLQSLIGFADWEATWHDWQNQATLVLRRITKT